MRAATVRKTAKAKAKRRRRVRWNHALGPWGNGFDAGWRDAHRRVNFAGSMGGGFPGSREPEAQRLYAEGYREARRAVDGPPQVRRLEGSTS